MKNQTPKTKLSKKSIALVFLIAIIIFSIVLGADGPEKIVNSLLSASPIWLLASILIFALAWIAEGAVLHLLIKHTINPKQLIKDSLNLAVIGKLFDNLTPMSTGGQPIQIWKMHKQGIPISKATSVLIFKFVIYQFSIIAIYLLVILFNLKQLQQGYIGKNFVIAIGFLVNLVVVFALAGAVFLPKALKKQIIKLINFLHRFKIVQHPKKTIKKTLTEIDDFYKSYKQINRNKPLVIKIIILTVIQICLIHTVSFAVFTSLGGTLNKFLASFSANNYVYLLSSFIPLPGASLGSEGSFILFFSNIYPKNAVTLAMIIWRFITYYLPILIGFLFVIDYKHIKVKISQLIKE